MYHNCIAHRGPHFRALRIVRTLIASAATNRAPQEDAHQKLFRGGTTSVSNLDGRMLDMKTVAPPIRNIATKVPESNPSTFYDGPKRL
jgi:hypothetical protein